MHRPHADICAMRNDYPERMRFKMMVDGRAGMIVCKVISYGRIKYHVVMDGEQMPGQVGVDDILPEDHPWHEKIKEWRAEGLAKGFTGIVIGLSRTGFRVFYCNDVAGYNELVRNHPGIHMKYYWKL